MSATFCPTCRAYHGITDGSWPCREARVFNLPFMPTIDLAETPKDTNPKTIYGDAKVPLSLVPAGALVHCAESFRDGADKYGPANWRVDPVSASTYANALLRHFYQWLDGEEADPESKVHHLGSVMANAAILLDAMEAGTLLDDRPPSAPTAALIRSMTRPIKDAP